MDKQRTLTVTLETVTPLFLGGADPRQPGLRAPAFRGALRYWLRASLGGVIGDSNLEGLYLLESTVFGSTDGASPIMVRVRGNLKHTTENILPHKEGRQAGPRKALSAGQSFDLMMSQLRTGDDTTWRAACSALNLALTFGGVGLRSRRGYGTLRIVRSSESTLVAPFPTSLDSWRQHIARIIGMAVTAARALAQARKVPIGSLPKDPARYPCATREGIIRLCAMKATKPMAVVTEFMTMVQKHSALGGISPHRQASPLWIRPIQLDKQYGLLFTVLASDFRGSDYKFVQKFLGQFPGENITVKGWNHE